MTNEELKKKIVDIIFVTGQGNDDYTDGERFIVDEAMAGCIANALIAAGIGDVKEVTHRAEVAERALKIAEELGELCAPRQYYIDKAKSTRRGRARKC